MEPPRNKPAVIALCSRPGLVILYADGGTVVEGILENNRCSAGWAKLGVGELHGRIVIHLGDESRFVAQRAKRQPYPKTKTRK
jgi:hypothetical protein